jgi:Carboxypeptidase regulatory-like domain
VRDAHVRFSSLGAGAAWERPRDFDCDVVGSYSGELPPGTWMASVVLGVSNSAPQRDDAISASNHPLRFLVQPLPRIDTFAAQTTTEFSFQFGVGPGAIDGRVLDEREQPFAGLEIYLAIKELENAATGEPYAMGLSSFVANQVTDEQGGFRFEGLEPATYTVSVEPEGFNPTAAPGESKVGQRVPLQEVVVGSGRASLELTAGCPHPIRIDGRVVPNASWASLTLILPANDQGRDRDRRTSVPIAQDGVFSFYVEGQELSAILELSGRETTTVPLALSPADEAFFITIPHP